MTGVPAAFATGTLPSGGTLATPVGPGFPPFTIQFNSTNSARAISLSANGTNFVGLVPSATAAGSLLAQWNGPIGQVLFAGAQGDTFNIL
jgi:hypothetical protein